MVWGGGASDDAVVVVQQYKRLSHQLCKQMSHLVPFADAPSFARYRAVSNLHTRKIVSFHPVTRRSSKWFSKRKHPTSHRPHPPPPKEEDGAAEVIRMIAREDETEADVRREDQERINRFARLNARAGENAAERAHLQKELEGLDDACTELMMGPSRDENEDAPPNSNNSAAPILILQGGETWFEVADEDEATAFCEARIEKLQRQLDRLQQEAADITAEQAELKQLLYGRFGKSINLETD